VRAEFKAMQDYDSFYSLFHGDSFTRLDESDDKTFYEVDRMVSHLDSVALAMVEKIIGTLVVEEDPVILDLMASWSSHIPASLQARRIVGLGLNQNELTSNERLTETVIHDLNANPMLPFPDNTFDIVLNTVSVDYIMRPFEVFSEVGRILKPSGLFLVTFSNRMFPLKAVKIWKESTEKERVELVKRFFENTPTFGEPQVFLSSGKPRPKDDKYYYTGLPSDPIYAVYAERRGDEYSRKRRPGLSDLDEASTPGSGEKESRGSTRDTLECPHCGHKLSKWAVPDDPFSTWCMEFLFICFNDECPYLVRGWRTMTEQGNGGWSYRYAYDPVDDSFMPMPIVSLHSLRDGIVSQ
jgi:SAM-dependent methyltransferase